MKYCADVAREGGRRAAEVLGTEVLDNGEGTMTRGCAFANVRLPLRVVSRSQLEGDEGERQKQGQEQGQARDIEVKEQDAPLVTQWLSSTVVTEFDTFMATVFYRGSWWVRFCGQVYLEVEDIVWGAEVLLGLCKRIGEREGECLRGDVVLSEEDGE